MRSLLTAAIIFLSVLASEAAAEQREAIGTGRLFTNDYFGDQRDRWRTGSYVLSHLRSPAPYDGQPRPFGDIIEYRFRGEIIAPQTGGNNEGMRPYVGALSLGAHTHFGFGGSLASLGADVTAIGPQTGLDRFQETFHEAFSLPLPSRRNQLDDEVFISGTAALSHLILLGDDVTLRPFAEAQVGVEDIVRVGGDVIIGAVGQEDLMLRDVVTGQLYRGTTSAGFGPSIMVGADIAAVGDSAYLPADSGYVASETRTRARAGVHYQVSEDISFFYGMTYLSEEFEGQPEGQVLGSLKLNFNF
ncbi:hypothetical protein SAMN04488515_0188 [Cognatiyoonia koreensis]|uniref:Outer membrane protein n=1 Tax=Cognatiyoonia koreensis TaxID=364200 RepID=A0A1I0MST8_9RHOB|nr:lipid A-modifier LpxR family protein [Cognatiyoonia koreensis]SEV91135.1 hypothetical protein SAMN04488515_0188 [Cognatiyoonia koreensis]